MRVKGLTRVENVLPLTTRRIPELKPEPSAACQQSDAFRKKQKVVRTYGNAATPTLTCNHHLQNRKYL
jgi:hypothetical protein